MADKENSSPHKRAKYMCKSSDKIAQEYPDITVNWEMFTPSAKCVKWTYL